MPDSRRCQLLDDSPRQSDSLGAHAPVADAIESMVRQNNGGRAIALEGSWGAGKSTVVRLLEGKLGRAHVFTFDAWAHERDPLRRVFLEQLVDCFGKRLDAETWTEKLERLSRRLQTAETEVTPRLTPLGSIVALATIFLPLGVAFLSAGLDPKKTGAESPVAGVASFLHVSVETFYASALYFGLFFAGFLPLVLFVVFGVGFIYSWRQPRSSDGKVEYPQWLAVFAKSEAHRQHARTVMDPEPSSVEFLSLFREAMKEGLKSSDAPFLLVIDNLDRVPRDTALEVWSTLRVFAEEFDRNDADWCERCWLLVPYDSPSLSALWESEGDSNSDSPSKTAINTSFLQKTFAATFSVPPPLLTDWQAFLAGLLEEAFPEHDQAERKLAADSVYLHSKNLSSPPTPRSLKIFVNRIVSLYLQWGDDIDLGTVAYFVALKSEGQDVEAMLRNGEAPDARHLEYLPAEATTKNLASLFYGRPSDAAMQLLLREPIERGFEDETGDQLKGLASRPGFPQVLDDVVRDLSDRWSSSAWDCVTAARAVSRSGINAVAKDHGIGLGARLSKAAPSSSWNDMDTSYVNGLVALLDLAPTRGDRKTILKGVIQSYGRDETERTISGEWSSAIYEVVSVAVERGYIDANEWTTKVPFPIESEIDSFYGAISRHGDDEGVLRILLPAVSTAKLTKALVSADDDEWSAEEYAASMLLADAGALDFGAHAIALYAKLDGGENDSTDVVRRVFDAMCSFARVDEKAHAKLVELASSGWIHHYVSTQAENEAAYSAAISAALIAHELGAEVAGAGNSADGQQRIAALLDDPNANEALVERLAEQAVLPAGDERDLLKALIGSSAGHSLARAILARALESDELAEQMLPLDAITPNWSDLRKCCASGTRPSYAALLKSLVARGLVENLVARGFSRANSLLYSDIFALDVESDRESLVSLCGSGLRDYDEATWLAVVSKGTASLQCLAAVKDANPSFEIDTIGYLDGLVAFARKLLSQEVDLVLGAEDAKILRSSLSESQTTVLGSRLVGLLESHHESVSDGIWWAFGEILSVTGALSESDRTVEFVLTKALTGGGQHAVDWLVDLHSRYPKYLSTQRPEFVSDYESRIAAFVADADKVSALPRLLELAEQLGVSPPLPAEEDDEEPDDED